MKISFLGAAGTVTGSKYVVETNGHRFLVDAGLFQGQKELRLRNWEELPIDPATFEKVVLTHAHIDHTGYLPRLGRDGFTGEILCTHATKELAGILLPDSAYLQEEQATYMNRKKLSKHKPALPLYTIADAEYVLRKLRAIRYRQPFEIVPGVTGVFRDAGHLLGSAWLELRLEGRRVVFSGDIGRTGAPLLRDPEPFEGADALILESTYGNRLHGEHDTDEDLIRVIERVVEQRGVLVIPAFAVERTQELVYLLQEMTRDDRIPNLPLFVDSPMAVKSTHVYEKFVGDLDAEAQEAWKESNTLLTGYDNLKLCESVEESKRIAEAKPPFIVMAASGMAEAGRILHHLRHYLPNPRNTVMLVGYQMPGSRGWRLQQGEKSIKIFGDWVEVKAQVTRLQGFSGHADYGQILNWVSKAPPPGSCFLTHGDPEALEAQRARLAGQGWNVAVPEHGETIEI